MLHDPYRTAAYHPDENQLPDTIDATAEQTSPASSSIPSEWPQLPGFAITAEIARGGMGCVYASRDLTLDRDVAIKTLLPGADSGRFVTEAKITARLPHPGIPPVHAIGTLEDGSPYLVMKRIVGRTMAATLKDRPSPRHELPRFVQAFEQIAQAVGFAHDRSIIHRDLKPLNVMVGEFGEVQVMDWGLAKVLGSTDGEAGANLADSESEHTQAGAVMGTPGYMSPEQARGEVVDARCDVFALGSILATILTGRPAFVGTTAKDTIEKAAKAETSDVLVRLDSSGADPELIGLAKWCLSTNPSDRPADASLVANEVSAYRAGVEARLRQSETDRTRAETQAAEQAKRRRVVQRAGGGIAAALIVGLGASLWQMNRAIAAEGEAKSNETAALTERDAKDLALKSETKALAEKSAALVAEANARKAEHAALIQTRFALKSLTNRIVELQMARDATLSDENKVFLRTIVKQYEALAAITSDDDESRSIRAEGLGHVGVMKFRLGELNEAEAAYDAALILRRRLAAELPSHPEVRRELASLRGNQGVLFQATGRPKEAEAAHREALTLREGLASEFADRRDFRSELAGSHNNMGVILQNTGRMAQAVVSFTAAAEIRKKLAAEDPSDSHLARGLGLSLNNLGVVCREIGRFKEAEAAYRDSVTVRKELAAESPTNPEIRRDLSVSFNNLAVLLQTTGRAKEAVLEYRNAAEWQKQLVAEFPGRPEYRQDLGRTHSNLGGVLTDIGRAEEAEAELTAALTLRKKLIADFPNRPEFRDNLANTYNALGNLLRRTGRMKEAEAAFTESVNAFQRLVEEHPTNPALRAQLAGGRSNLAVVLRDTGRTDEAEAEFREALKHHEQLAIDHPSNPGFCNNLARARVDLGNLLWDSTRFLDAEREIREARIIQKKLADKYPAQPDYRLDWVGSTIDLGHLIRESGRPEESLAFFTEAINALKSMLKAHPDHPQAPVCLRNGHSGRAQAYDKLKKYSEAVEDWGRTMVLPPVNQQKFMRAFRATSMLRAGRIEDAVSEVDELTKNPNWDAKGWLSFARIYSVAAGRIANEKMKHADRAMEMLQNAVKRGHSGDSLAKDGDFDALREREDFKRMLASLPSSRIAPEPAPAPRPATK